MDLIDSYKEAINEAINVLENNYQGTKTNPINDDYPNVFDISVSREGEIFDLTVAIPRVFPDKLPKIYLSDDDFQKTFPIPHVDMNKFVCTRDTNTVYINEYKSGEALNELIEIAINEIILRGIKGENSHDFLEEFLAYWNDQNSSVLSLYTPINRTEVIGFYELNSLLLKCRHIIAEKRSDVEKWISKMNAKCVIRSERKILYLPLPSAPKFPLPENNGDILKFIESYGTDITDIFDQFYKDDESNIYVLFSFLINDKRILAGWGHAQWDRVILMGFRNSKLPIKERLLRNKTTGIKRLNTERIDRERLFGRVGTQLDPTILNSKIGILGCGSLGSLIANTLSKCGIRKFSLFDNDQLKPENTPRHLCGFSDIQNNPLKVNAVKSRLESHFPDIECSTNDGDLLDLFMDNPTKLNENNLIISATANHAVERRLNKLQRDGIITQPILYLWIEPFGVGGQFLYIHQSKGGCYQCCFDSEGHFSHAISDHENDLETRETGHQITFLPYSYLEAESLTTFACRNIMRWLLHPEESSMLTTWLGDLNLFRSNGISIRDEWGGDTSFSTYVREIPKEGECPVCN